MDLRRTSAGLFLCGLLAARAGTAAPEEPSPVPVRAGAVIGLVSLPRPTDIEIFVRLFDLFAVGLGYSDFPAFIANPLLDLVGANSGTTSATLGQFDAYEVHLRFFPARRVFFIGASFGRQSLQGTLTESTTQQSARVDLTTWYFTPRIGWLWRFEPGLLLGFDLGVQLKLASDQVVVLPASATPDIRQRVENLADLGASYPLPSLRLRIGWML
jgi:hypothetical protein